jgi:hypothetical protein
MQEDMPGGPWGIAELPAAERTVERIDLGGILVLGVEGMRLQLETADGVPLAATFRYPDALVQLQAFAAPLGANAWAEVRASLRESFAQRGDSFTEEIGPFGIELHTVVDDERGLRFLRFIGVEGPGWLLRCVMEANTPISTHFIEAFEAVIRSTVIVNPAESTDSIDPIPLRPPRTDNRSG